MTRPLFVYVGLALLATAGLVSGVAYWDGVLGTTPFDEFPAPGQTAESVTIRLIVTGSVEDADAILARLEGSAFPPGRYVPARAESGVPVPILVRVGDESPAPGDTLVVKGPVHMLWGQGSAGAADGSPIALLLATEYREPLIF